MTKRMAALLVAALLVAGGWTLATAQGAPPSATTQASAQPAAIDSSFAAQGASRPGRVHVLRLRPGQDLRAQLVRFARVEHIQAGWIASAVGSVRQATLRFSNRNEATIVPGPFEIVTLSGTLAESGVHFHAAFSDSTGRTIGGHLMDGCPIYTTAEIVIAEAADLVFSRQADKATGFRELNVRPRGPGEKK